MAESVEVATGYVTLVASAKGIKSSIEQEFGSQLTQVGQQGGQNLADGVEGGAGGKMKAAGALLGGLILGGITAAIAGVGKILADTISQESQAANLTARLGLGPEDTARMGKLSGEVYAQNYGTGLDQVNDAIVRITQDIGDGSKEWTQQTTKDVLTVANTFDQDLGGTTRAVGQLIRTGLVKDATEGLDLITKGIQVGADKSEDLLDTFNEYGTQFRKLGLDGPKALGLISQAMQAGARDSDVAADALKEFSIRAVDGSKTTADGFKAIGLNAEEMTKAIAKGGESASKGLDRTLEALRNVKDPAAQAQAAVQLFGTQAEDLGQALFAMDGSHAVEQLGQVEGSVKKVNDVISDTAENRIETFKRSIQQGLIDFMGGKVIPFFQNLASKIDLSGVLATLQEWAGKAREIWNKVVEDVRTFVQNHQAELTELGTKAKAAFEDLKIIVADVFTAISFLWDQFGSTWLASVLANIQMIVTLFQAGFQNIRGIIDFFKGLFTGDMQLTMDGANKIVDAGFKAMGAIADLILGNIARAAGFNWDAIKQKFSDGVQWAKDQIARFAEIVGSVISWMIEMKNGITRKWDEIRDFFSGIPQKIKDALGSPGDLLYGVGSAIVQSLLDGLKSKWNEVTGFVKGLAPWIAANKGPMSYDRVLLTPAGEAIMDSLLNGLQSRDAQLQSYIGSITTRMGLIGAAEMTPMGGIGQNPQFTVIVNQAEGQSADSVSETVINKLILQRRVT